MKKLIVPALMAMALVSCRGVESSSTPDYWFDRPAAAWEESIPLGNGRMGMMPWGGVESERIVLNEISLWSGNCWDSDNPDALGHLSEIRRLLFAGREAEAQRLMYGTFTCLGEGSEGPDYGCYQNFGNLWLDFTGVGSTDTVTENYRRELDLDRAVSCTTFTRNGIDFTREYFT
jgi:alpha-L-fucosidase 2